MKNLLLKKIWIPGWLALAALVPACSHDDLRKELRQTDGELRLENRELREKVAALDKQLAQLTARFEEWQRAGETGRLKALGNQIAAQVEAKQGLEAEARLRAEQTRHQATATIKRLAAQMDRLVQGIPSLEIQLTAWDLAIPQFSNLGKDGALQMNSLVAELEALKFPPSEAVKGQVAHFMNGYDSLPGIGRIVLNSRERAAALRAIANASATDLDAAASEEVTMNAQLSVFNATLAECKKLLTEVSHLAD